MYNFDGWVFKLHTYWRYFQISALEETAELPVVVLWISKGHLNTMTLNKAYSHYLTRTGRGTAACRTGTPTGWTTTATRTNVVLTTCAWQGVVEKPIKWSLSIKGPTQWNTNIIPVVVLRCSCCCSGEKVPDICQVQLWCLPFAFLVQKVDVISLEIEWGTIVRHTTLNQSPIIEVGHQQ